MAEEEVEAGEAVTDGGLTFGELAEALKPLANERRLKLLHYLTTPHYLGEIASFLGISRQGARKHVERLLELGVVEKRQGERPSGPVVEYVLVPQRLFALSEKFSNLGRSLPQVDEESLSRTETMAEVGIEQRPTSGPALALVHGLHPGRTYPLEPGQAPWTIGRDPEREIALEFDPYASNQHAQIERADGGFEIVDTFSTNGTFVNWKSLPQGSGTALTEGDVVQVGKTLLVFWA